MNAHRDRLASGIHIERDGRYQAGILRWKDSVTRRSIHRCRWPLERRQRDVADPDTDRVLTLSRLVSGRANCPVGCDDRPVALERCPTRGIHDSRQECAARGPVDSEPRIHPQQRCKWVPPAVVDPERRPSAVAHLVAQQHLSVTGPVDGPEREEASRRSQRSRGKCTARIRTNAGRRSLFAATASLHR